MEGSTKAAAKELLIEIDKEIEGLRILRDGLLDRFFPVAERKPGEPQAAATLAVSKPWPRIEQLLFNAGEPLTVTAISDVLHIPATTVGWHLRKKKQRLVRKRIPGSNACTWELKNGK